MGGILGLARSKGREGQIEREREFGWRPPGWNKLFETVFKRAGVGGAAVREAGVVPGDDIGEQCADGFDCGGVLCSGAGVVDLDCCRGFVFGLVRVCMLGSCSQVVLELLAEFAEIVPKTGSSAPGSSRLACLVR